MKYFLDLGKTLRVRINLKLLELKYKALVADLKSKNFDFRSSFFKKLVADIYPTVLQGLQGSTRSEYLSFFRDLLVSVIDKESRFLIHSMALRKEPLKDNWHYQNEELEWEIEANMKVLDIGSGGHPFKHATHLADKFPNETTHRVEPLNRDGRPFFEVDIERLPFDKKAYDFVFCSHVLEHLDHPGDAMREIMRVGKSGYIEIPTRLSDIIFNFTFLEEHHKWHGLVTDNTVILTEWTDCERKKYKHNFFNAIQSDHTNDMQSFFEENREVFFHSLRWNSSFDFLVINKVGKVIDFTKGALDQC